jgi:hypothetical protein
MRGSILGMAVFILRRLPSRRGCRGREHAVGTSEGSDRAAPSRNTTARSIATLVVLLKELGWKDTPKATAIMLAAVVATGAAINFIWP